MTTEQTETVIPEKSKGQIFRDKYGITPTFKRNMYRNGFKNWKSKDEQDRYRVFRQAKKTKVAKHLQATKK